MAVSTLKDAKSDTTNGTSYTGNAFTPTASALLLVFVQASGTVLANPTLTDSQGLGFTLVTSCTFTSTADSIYCFVANTLAAASSMTVTFDCTGDAATGVVIFTWQLTSVTRTGSSAIKQSAVVSDHAISTPAISFAASALTGNPTLGVIGNGSNPATLTPPTNWTEPASGDTGYANPTRGAETVSRDSGFTGTTITWGNSAGSNWGGIIVEIDTSAGATTFNQTLAVSATFTPAIVKQVKKTLAIGATLTTALLKSGGKALAAAATFTAAMVKRVGKILAVPTLPPIYNNFDGGVNGSNVLVGDTGSGTPFEAISLGTGTTITYDNAHVHSGSLAGKVVIGGTTTTAYAQWDTSMPDVAEAWSRVYVYLTGLPSVAIRVMAFFANDGGTPGAVEITSAGKVRVFYRGTNSSLSTTVLPTNQWVRLGLHVIANASTGAVDCRIFTDPESATPDETVSVSGVNTGAAVIDRAVYGQIAAWQSSLTFWIDDAAASTLGWIGGSGAWRAQMTGLKAVPAILAVTATFTVAMVRSVGKVLAIAGTFTVALARRAGKVLAITGTFTVTMLRQVGKPLAIAASFTTALVKQVGKKLTVSSTYTTTMAAGKASLKTLAATVTMTPAFVRTVGKRLAVAGSWIADLLSVRRTGQPSYFLPPTEETLHSRDRYEWVIDEDGRTRRTRSARSAYAAMYRTRRAVQLPTDPAGYYVVGGFPFRGGYWNGPLTGPEIAAITAAGLADRIRQASDPGQLPAGID